MVYPVVKERESSMQDVTTEKTLNTAVSSEVHENLAQRIVNPKLERSEKLHCDLGVRADEMHERTTGKISSVFTAITDPNNNVRERFICEKLPNGNFILRNETKQSLLLQIKVEIQNHAIRSVVITFSEGTTNSMIVEWIRKLDVYFDELGDAEISSAIFTVCNKMCAKEVLQELLRRNDFEPSVREELEKFLR